MKMIHGRLMQMQVHVTT